MDTVAHADEELVSRSRASELEEKKIINQQKAKSTGAKKSQSRLFLEHDVQRRANQGYS